MAVNTVCADLWHRPSQTAPFPAPSHLSTSKMRWVKFLLSQEWMLSRQPAATFWHSKLSQMLQNLSCDALQPGKSAVLGSVWFSSLPSDVDHATLNFCTQGSSSTFTQFPVPPEKSCLQFMSSMSRTYSLRITLEKLRSVCLLGVPHGKRNPHT